jgi:hypothetical protein
MSGIACLVATSSGLRATPSGTFFYGAIAGPGTAITNACTVTTTGGSGSYSYAWSRTSGDATIAISSAASATVSWSHTFGVPAVLDAFWQCVVTDTGTGQSVTISNIQAELERSS